MSYAGVFSKIVRDGRSKIFHIPIMISDAPIIDMATDTPRVIHTFLEKICLSGDAYTALWAMYPTIERVKTIITRPIKFPMLQILSALFSRVKHEHIRLVKKNLVCAWNKRTCSKFITLNNKRR